MFQKAIAIQREVLGEKHPDLAISYNNMGLLYHNQGDYAQALAYQTLAVEIAQKFLPTTHPNRILMKNIYQYYLSKQAKN